MNPTFNGGIDYFGLAAATNNALAVESSKENRTKSSTSGSNTYGDAARVDSWGETAAPSAEYTVVGPLSSSKMLALGAVINAAEGLERPIVLGGISINTSKGAPPAISVSGQMVHTGAKQLRKYTLPNFSLTPRHRAQDMMGLVNILVGDAEADDTDDYGLESVNANFPIEFSLAQPKGETKNYDLHGGMATCAYTMNWYAADKPKIQLTEEAVALGATISAPVALDCPGGNYTTYTWTVSFPMLGEEVA
jgi:hypothetical protein